MILLTDDENKSYEEQEVCHVSREEFFCMIKVREINLNYTKKLKITVITPENLEELLITFAI